MGAATGTDDIDELRRSALFAALDDDGLRLLRSHCSERHVLQGDTVFVEGDASHVMYLIREGEVEIVKRAGEGTFRVAVLGQGEWFGEVGLLAVSRHVATARAVHPSRLFELHARALHELYQHDIRGYALLTMNLARGLARKLQLAETLLADALVARARDERRRQRSTARRRI